MYPVQQARKTIKNEVFFLLVIGGGWDILDKKIYKVQYQCRRCDPVGDNVFKLENCVLSFLKSLVFSENTKDLKKI